MKFALLTRDQFRERVFARDKYRCVKCGASAVDAHHILERKLWSSKLETGGYFLENGASLCEEHHLEAESTLLSCDELRALAGIKYFPLPEHLYQEQPYDKWGNPILNNGLRLRGELFDDVSVQKILQPVLNLFTDRVKYPRTYHFPWSPGVSNSERVLPDLSEFEQAAEVVVTAKMDGENSTLFQDNLPARSISYEPHPSRSWLKSLHAQICGDIPPGWRVCGENLFAKHSIKYNNLSDYFQVFSLWNERNICMDWDSTVEWAELLGLQTVPVLYRGKWNEQMVRNLYQPELDGDPCEGYVARIAGSFHYKKFKNCVAKNVKANFVQTDQHWIQQEVERNNIKGLRSAELIGECHR